MRDKHPARKRAKPVRLASAGDHAGFLGCGACMGEGDFAVVCRGVPATPHIVALVCLDCGGEVAVEDGEPRAPRQEAAGNA
jgi:hypothetical protein